MYTPILRRSHSQVYKQTMVEGGGGKMSKSMHAAFCLGCCLSLTFPKENEKYFKANVKLTGVLTMMVNNGMLDLFSMLVIQIGCRSGGGQPCQYFEVWVVTTDIIIIELLHPYESQYFS